jgi:serine protease DegQ
MKTETIQPTSFQLMKPILFVLTFFGSSLCVRADDPPKTEGKVHHVPYRLTSTNHVLVRAKINGKGPFNFIIDTGAPALFVATAVGSKLGVEPGANGWATLDRFEIEGGVVIEKAKGRIEDPFQLEGMNGLGLAGVQLHGMIGYNILARNRITFDFTKNKMVWEPLDFKPPAPQGLGGQAAPGGLDALGSVMKFIGAFLGKKPDPDIVLRGFLGVGLKDQGDKLIVERVLEESPAAKAGVKAGDQISALQDKPVSSAAEFRKQMARLKSDDAARLAIVRNGSTQTLEVKPGRGF